jgi:hypothetical protein
MTTARSLRQAPAEVRQGRPEETEGTENAGHEVQLKTMSFYKIECHLRRFEFEVPIREEK